MKFILTSLLTALIFNNVLGQIETNPLSEINSPAVEYAPSISADGQVMVFQSNRSGEYQLYESTKDEEGKWSRPLLLKGEISSFGDSRDLIGGPSLSYDGNFLFFFASFEDGLGIEDIYYSIRENDTWGTPQNIGSPINTRKYEGFPSISSDGNSLYFMRLNANRRNNMNCYTLYIAHRDGLGKWQKPTQLPKPINLGCEKYPRIMSDNTTLIFSSAREDSKEGSFDLYQTSHLGGNKWSPPIPLDYANTNGHDYFAAVSSQADHIYLNSSKEGNYDILSYKIPDHLKPKKVYNVQGTVSDQLGNPLLSTIKIFSKHDDKLIANLPSNATDGSYTLVLPEGGYHITVNAEGYYPLEDHLHVAHPKHTKSINKNIKLTPFSGKAIVKVTNQRTNQVCEAVISVIDLTDSSKVIVDKFSFDIKYGKQYLIEASGDGYRSDTTTLLINSIDDNTIQVLMPLIPKKPEVTFQPRDAKTNAPISISLMVKNRKTKQTHYRGKLNSDTTLTLNFRSKYSVYALSSKYLFLKETLDLMNTDSYSRQDHVILLQPVEVGAKLTLDEVLFESNSSELDQSSYEELVAVYQFLKYNRTIVVEIAAHTDNIGSMTANQTLSDQRAQSVVDFLISKGVNANRIDGKGYGETEPISSNHTHKGRGENRRVEFRVLKVK